MTRASRHRCSSCGGGSPSPVFWWLCRSCVERIEGEPVRLGELDPDQGDSRRKPSFGTVPEDKRAHKVPPQFLTALSEGRPWH